MRTPLLLSGALLGSLLAAPAALAGEPLPPRAVPCAPCAPPAPAPVCDPCACPPDAVAKPLIAGWLACTYDRLQEWKKCHGVPIEVGAWHWFHYGNDSGDLDYGLPPNLDGTYYWYVTVDPSFDVCSRWVTKAGVHAQVRFRENDDPFRPWFDENVWLWEAYAWAETPIGKLKAGDIWKRFGFDWDGSWYGNLPYFDGWKLDPDWGVSWERSGALGGRGDFAWDAFAQVFFAEDEVNGSIAGADAESSDDSEEGITGVLRFVPKWRLPDCSTLALGASLLVGEVEHETEGDDTIVAAAVDASWTKDRFKVYGEAMWSEGVVSEAHYVTGGPSDSSFIWSVGAHYVVGPATLRATFQRAEYENPGGEQDFLLVGATIALVKNVDLYVEYVKWDVEADGADEVEFEDGWNFILHWRL